MEYKIEVRNEEMAFKLSAILVQNWLKVWIEPKLRQPLKTPKGGIPPRPKWDYFVYYEDGKKELEK